MAWRATLPTLACLLAGCAANGASGPQTASNAPAQAVATPVATPLPPPATYAPPPPAPVRGAVPGYGQPGYRPSSAVGAGPPPASVYASAAPAPAPYPPPGYPPAPGYYPAPAPDPYLHIRSKGTYQCLGRPVAIDSNHTDVHLQDGCRTLLVTGSHNDVLIYADPGSTIQVTGIENDIVYRLIAPGPPPYWVDQGGHNNKLYRNSRRDSDQYHEWWQAPRE